MRGVILTCALSLFGSVASGHDNPFLNPGATVADGKPGAFGQNNSGDCFFLASLIAIAQDPDGQALIESSMQRNHNNGSWRITFPNLPTSPIEITPSEHASYRLTNSDGDGLSAPANGDPDVGLLEIAADKIWKSTIKMEGLWDDVPMNALFMFSNAPQLLLWNREQAAKAHKADIDKYLRLPSNIVTEMLVNTSIEAKQHLQNLIHDDKDGISLILIDYIDYHAEAIVDVDFDAENYHYINPHQNELIEGDLKDLYDGLAGGYFALNYIEIAPPPL